jgi:hypothetical protein
LEERITNKSHKVLDKKKMIMTNLYL